MEQVTVYQFTPKPLQPKEMVITGCDALVKKGLHFHILGHPINLMRTVKTKGAQIKLKDGFFECTAHGSRCSFVPTLVSNQTKYGIRWSKRYQRYLFGKWDVQPETEWEVEWEKNDS